MYLTKIITSEVETLLRLLAELKREVVQLVMQEQQEAEWQVLLHCLLHWVGAWPLSFYKFERSDRRVC